MLLVFPSTPMTEKASHWLDGQGVGHTVIEIPDSLDYKTGSDTAIYIESEDMMDIPMRLSKERFVVMRVFKDFRL